MIDFSTLQGLTIPEGVVAEIADEAGSVLWSSEPIIISFSVKFGASTETYQAENRMTWAKFVDSDYNPGAFVVSGTSVLRDTAYGRFSVKNVVSTDVIKSGTTYEVRVSPSPR